MLTVGKRGSKEYEFQLSAWKLNVKIHTLCKQLENVEAKSMSSDFHLPN